VHEVIEKPSQKRKMKARESHVIERKILFFDPCAASALQSLLATNVMSLVNFRSKEERYQ